MGEEKYQKEIESLFERSPIVDFKSIERIVKDKKRLNQYAKQLVRNLLIKGKIKKLTRGFYTRFDDPSLAVFCFKPAYLSLQDALSFHNLWEQETIPIIITSKKVRQGTRKVMGMNVLVRRIESKYMFGFKYSKSGEFFYLYSDIEKTFIDMVYFNENLNDEALNEIKKRIDKKKLDSYLKNYPKRFEERVAGLTR